MAKIWLKCLKSYFAHILYYNPGPNFSFHTPANYVPPAPSAPAPATPILPPLIYHATPPVHHVSATAQLPIQLLALQLSAQSPMQLLPVHPSDPVPEPFPDNAYNLYTSRISNDINKEDSMEDSQGESLSS
jgi:hypothetical protein